MPNIDKPYSYVPLEGHSQGDLLGITSAEIEAIVHNFYTKVQQDPVLGPIFEKELSEKWDEHLVKMCNFWTTVMFGKPLYKGNPLIAHSKIAEIKAEHFDRWLNLFQQTLQEVCPNSEHAEAFHQRARTMARVMTSALQVAAST